MSSPSIQLRLLLEGGHSQTLEINADSPELVRLFQVLGARTSGSDEGPEQFFQLPLDSGQESFSFSSQQLVAVCTRPPVVVDFERPRTPEAPVALPDQAADARVHRPDYMVIDNFLGHYEHIDMLAYALQQENKFDAGTVATGEKTARQNLAIMDFAQAPHSRLLSNRLLTWLPLILQKLGIAPFPVHQLESQLTASNDGHYYRAHLDADANSDIQRVLTCVYYFSKQPAQFAGGALRIYDKLTENNQTRQADTFQQIEPVSNRMVVFPSDSYHELRPIRCPSRQFEDSRFAVTSWVWSQEEPDENSVHGWGHMKCGKAPNGWLRTRG